MSLSEQFKQQQSNFKNSSSSEGLITGVSVPVSINRNGAKLRMHIQLSADALANPQALEAALNEIEQVFDLDVWQPGGGGGQSSGFKSGGGYGGGGNSYGGNRSFGGGYNNNRRY